MPIKIDRNTGEVMLVPELTPEQNQEALEIILRTYLKKHPEKLLEHAEDENDKGPG